MLIAHYVPIDLRPAFEVNATVRTFLDCLSDEFLETIVFHINLYYYALVYLMIFLISSRLRIMYYRTVW